MAKNPRHPILDCSLRIFESGIGDGGGAGGGGGGGRGGGGGLIM